MRCDGLQLDWTPDQNGSLPIEHVEAYQGLGDFIRYCYGNPVASTSFTGLMGDLVIPSGKCIHLVGLMRSAVVVRDFTLHSMQARLSTV